MEKLFTVDFGLMVWTVTVFGLLVAVLAKFGWRPLIDALDEREARMKADLEGALAARDGAEKIKTELGAQMAHASAKERELLAQAAKEAEALAAKIRAEAETQAKSAKEKTLAELEEEKRRLIRELRSEVAGLSVMAAEKILRRSVDPQVEKEVLADFLKDMEKRKS